MLRAAADEEVQRDVAERAAAGLRGVRRVGLAGRERVVGGLEHGLEPLDQRGHEAVADRVDLVGIDVVADGAGDIALRRQGQREAP